jgi:hypothetical protein
MVFQKAGGDCAKSTHINVLGSTDDTAAISLHFMHYNFCRIHQTLRSTPAIKAGVADPLWSIEETVELLEKNKVSSN